MAKEKDFNVVFNHWLKAKHQKTGAYELKITHTDSIPFSSVKPHQVAALQAAKSGCLVYKIPDVGLGQKPFDNICLAKTSAFVVIKYPKFFCLIDVASFVSERDSSIRKSLTAERARLISKVIVETGA